MPWSACSGPISDLPVEGDGDNGPPRGGEDYAGDAATGSPDGGFQPGDAGAWDGSQACSQLDGSLPDATPQDAHAQPDDAGVPDAAEGTGDAGEPEAGLAPDGDGGPGQVCPTP